MWMPTPAATAGLLRVQEMLPLLYMRVLPAFVVERTQYEFQNNRELEEHREGCY